MSEEVSIYGDEPTYIVGPPKSTPKVKIKKLHPDAVIPTKATPESACYDVYAPEDFVVRPGRSGLRLNCHKAMQPRSGLAPDIPQKDSLEHSHIRNAV